MDNEQLTRDIEMLDALDPLTVQLYRGDALVLLTLLQLVVKQEKLPPKPRDLARKFADTLENAVAITPALRAAVAKGWQ
jgi:hypothetical protein